MLIRFCLSISFLLIAVKSSNAQETEWDVVSRNMVRFSPDSFPELPENISAYLKSEEYTIPQAYLTLGAHNVIKGSFRSVGQIDWAVLASKNLESSILFFWNGSLDKVTSIAKHPDKEYLQKMSNGAIVFSRSIEVIGRKMILEQIKKLGQNKSRIKEHSGINDRFQGNTSSIHYLSDDEWYNFQGAD